MNKSWQDVILENGTNPFVQSALLVVLGLIIIGIAKLLHLGNVLTMEITFPWLIAASFLLFYAIMNSIVSLVAKEVNVYWFRSICGFAALALTSGIIAWLFSNLNVYEAGSYSWIFVVVSVVYLVFVSIMSSIRKIVEIAIKQDKKLRNEE